MLTPEQFAAPLARQIPSPKPTPEQFAAPPDRQIPSPKPTPEQFDAPPARQTPSPKPTPEQFDAPPARQIPSPKSTPEQFDAPPARQIPSPRPTPEQFDIPLARQTPSPKPEVCSLISEPRTTTVSKLFSSGLFFKIIGRISLASAFKPNRKQTIENRTNFFSIDTSVFSFSNKHTDQGAPAFAAKNKKGPSFLKSLFL
jgi:hypothetical protein